MNYADLFRVTLPETALEVAALLVLVVDLGFLRKAGLKTRVAVAAMLGVVGCGAALWAVLITGGTGLSYGDELLLSVGGTAAVAQVGILLLTALTLLLLIGTDFTKNVGEYVAVVLMAATGGLLIASAQDLLVIFIGLELLSLGLYILTAFAKSSGKSAEAAIKYYLFGGMSAAFLLFGFSYLYGIYGTTSLQGIAGALAEDGNTTPMLYVAIVLVGAGLGFKVAAAPFHLWAPDTYEGAPIPAAAFIASVSKVASFALLLTISTNWLLPLGPLSGPRETLGIRIAADIHIWMPWATLLILAAAASMILGNLAALAQTSVRRLLAYSAIAHAGYILLGVAIWPLPSFYVNGGFPTRELLHRSLSAVLFYVLTYGLTTVGAFGVVDVVERATGSDRMDAFLGLHKRNPALAAVLLILFLSLAGIPPLVGFWAKFNLFAAVLSVGAGPVPFALVALAVALSAVSLYYYIQVLKRAYVMQAVDETPIAVHPVRMIVLVGIAAAVVLLGMFPAVLQGWIAGFYPVM